MFRIFLLNIFVLFFSNQSNREAFSLGFAKNVTVPLNTVQVFDKTFEKERIM